jgi:acyl transferase domain-containing protein/NADPH:quinone reductase-like Zn-dependent oxidoreductase/SAM-dependent methyltransferase
VAIVSGVTQISFPTDIVGMSNHGFLGQKGKCHTFDHRADGYARGEGVGSIIVKRLSDAVRDGDTIRGVIRATGVNQDGRTPGISLPSSEAQEKLIRQVYASAGLDMKDTMMVEAHGTGTSAGDPLEAAAISRSFAGRSKDVPLFVGALKSGIGHLEGGAGVASVIKSILVLENAIIPPNVNFEKANPRIPVAKYNIQFPLEPTPWPSSGVRRISINSFGVGGTNGHMILDDAYSYLHDNGLQGRHNTRLSIPSKEEVMSIVDRAKADTESHANGHVNCVNGHSSGVNGHSNGVNGHSNGVNGHSNGVNCHSNGVNGHSNGVNGHSNGVKIEPSRLVLLSAHDEAGVQRNAKLQSKYLSNSRYNNLDSYTHTLNKRTVFQWRSFVTSNSTSELSSSLSTANQPLRVKSKPSLGFVFTGQGAQWHAMGQEFMSYPIFAQSLQGADRYYRSLGATWSLLDELSKSKENTQVNEPWLAHPSCTALQMAIVDLLESFGIQPKRVVGHSSGEIAAAYCAGKLSQEAAWKVAFFRGVVSAKQLTAKGSMMAVGLSPDDATAYLEPINANGSGRIIVACLNSPNNCTISGDDQMIDTLMKVLTEANVFARKLSVKNAYHSDHMREVAGDYLSLLGDLPKAPHCVRSSVEYFSTLTGQQITDDHLPGQYWVDNLVSPVQFGQGLLSMLASTIRKGQATVKLNSSGRALAVDLLLEIGPHAAMQSAIRENIATRKDSQAITTLGLLNRSQPTLSNALKAIGQLWTLGYPILVSQVNQIDPSSIPAMDTKAPGYNFNHSDRILVESRIVKNYRLRKHPRHDLFGAPVPDWNQEYPRWRNYLSVEEQPWLRDHQITGSIIFPAVGYLISALEALRQITDPKDKIAAFRFKDVSFKRALIIPDEKDGVEVMLALSRMDESSLWGSSTWRNFHVSSYNPVGDDWIEHCTGYIAADLEKADNPIDEGRERQQTKQKWAHTIENVNSRCVLPVDVESIYDNLVTSGVAFGPLFRNLSGLQGTADQLGEISGLVTVPEIAANMPKGFAHEHLVHPATLDPMLQLFLMSLLDLMGRKTLDRPIVPTFIKECWISADMDANSASTYFGHAKSTLLAFDKYESNVEVYSQACKDLKVSFKGIRASFLDASDSSSGNRRALCHEMTWKPHLESLTNDALKDAPLQSEEDHAKYAGQIERFQTATVLLILDSLQELGTVSSEHFDGHFQKYYKWMLQVREWYEHNQITGTTKAVIDQYASDLVAKEALLKSVASENADGELAVRMGTNITKVLKNEDKALRLMFDIDDLLDRVYGQVAHLGDLPILQKEYLKLVDANKSNLRILEIGAGTGSSTVPMLQNLATVASDGVLVSSRIEKYTFTDVSAAFFEKAKEKFPGYRDFMDFKVLDAERDAGEQGFELGTYDFVVAQNVIHATKDLRVTLSHARKLLKPGGRLLLQEGVRQDFLWSGIAFGQLPGWWAGVEPIRPWSPWVSIPQWNEILKDAGYTGIDLDLKDRQDAKLHTQSLFIATNKVSTKKPQPETIIITSQPLADGLSSTVQTLKQRFEESGVNRISVKHFADMATEGMALGEAAVLCVMELERGPMLAELTEEEFESIRQIITICKGMLWVTGDALKQPAYAMIDGLCRSIRWERDIEDANLIPLHFSDDEKSRAIMIPKILDMYRQQLLEDLPLAEINGEFKVEHGVVYTSRLVDGEGADDYLMSRFSRPKPVMKPLKDAGRPIKLTTAAPGLLDKLEWVTDSVYSKPLKPSEIEVDIKAVGLNFRDLMITMGEHMACSIGCEAAGIITRMGSDVKDFKVGDRVVYLTGHEDNGTFQTYGRVDQNVVVVIPDDLDYETAASLPCVYATTIYGLVDAGRLEKGEKILIHAAAGGVGQAAIQFAQYKGAEIFATVSSKVKRELLMTEYGLPEDHIFSSRDMTFVDGVKRMTDGYGVDVVLNSLSGEALRNSWDLLAPFGRFIEIGKKDAQANGKVSLSPYLRNVTMASVELPTMMRHRPHLIKRLTADAVDLWKGGHIHAARPTKVMSFAQTEEALRILQSGKGTGKIVMVPRSDDILPVVPAQPSQVTFTADASYVFSGGLGGIGRSMALWMAARGAKHLIFLSRSGNITEDIAETISTLELKGVNVRIFKCDVSDKARLAEVVEDCRSTLPPIKGVIQGAMVLDVSAPFQHARWRASLICALGRHV